MDNPKDRFDPDDIDIDEELYAELISDEELRATDGDSSDTDETQDSDNKDDFKPGVLKLHGQTFAVGLTWLISEDDQDTELAKLRAKTIGADFYAFRSMIVLQQGFGYLSKGHKSGMRAAAAIAADTLVGEWHAIFQADNGWWYVAVHSDAIAPEGDLFFTSEEEAYDYFISRNNAHQWPRIYCPKHWTIADSNGEVTLSQLLIDETSTTLKPATLDGFFGGAQNKNITLVAALICFALLIGAVFIKQIFPSMLPEIAQDPVAVVDAPEIIQAPPPEPISISESVMNLYFEDTQLPKPSEVVKECMRGIADLSVSFPGWKQETITCKGTRVEGKWARVTGSIQGLRSHIDQLPLGSARRYDGSNSFFSTKDLGNLSRHNQNVSFLKREDAILIVNNRFADIAQLNVSEITPTLPQPEIVDQRGGRDTQVFNLTLQDLPALDLVIRSQTPPQIIAEYFDIDGMALNMITWDRNNGVWEYKARVFMELTQAMKSQIEQMQVNANAR